MRIKRSSGSSRTWIIANLTAVLYLTTPLSGAEQGSRPATFDSLSVKYTQTIYPLLEQYCADCHEGANAEAELDLVAIQSMDQIRDNPEVWIKVDEMLATQQMPPKKSDQLNDQEHEQLLYWVQQYLGAEAALFAGDPGRVVLRRLNKAEYTYTIRDLTGVPALDPVKEFPVDGAAGEGFINTGDSLSVSPSLIQKYLDAAKEIASHAILLPDGIRFSEHTTRRDWTDDLLASIRAFYSRYTDTGGGMPVNLQGIEFDTNQGGVLPLDRSLAALEKDRKGLENGTVSIANLAARSNLNEKYLRLLHQSLSQSENGVPSSFLLDHLRYMWQEGASAEAIGKLVGEWQKPLWRLTSIGHLRRAGGPKGWLVEETPLKPEQAIDFELPDPDPNADGITIVLETSTGGDGADGDLVVWNNPRLTGGTQPDLPLRDLQGLERQLTAFQEQALEKTSGYLRAASEITPHADLDAIATKYGLHNDVLAAWLNYLNLAVEGEVPLTGLFEQRIEKASNYDFIKGWGSPDTPSIVANGSDQSVRIPGLANAGTVMVHPSPTRFVGAAWRCPETGLFQINSHIEDAHPECGNGVEWFLMHRTAGKDVVLWTGEFGARGSRTMPQKTLSVRRGELITLLVDPRDGNHGCDLTRIDLSLVAIDSTTKRWDLADDISSDYIATNPHPDQYGNADTWNFYSGETADIQADGIRTLTPPADSLVEAWLKTESQEHREQIVEQIQTLVTHASGRQVSAPNALMLQHFRQLAIPSNWSSLLDRAQADPRFGRHPNGEDIPSTDIVVRAPTTLSFKIPSVLAEDRRLVATAAIESRQARPGSAQVRIGLEPELSPLFDPAHPLLVRSDSATGERWRKSLYEFRQLFPPTLCYSKIVPVDEVVTLTLFYREDHHLQRLMLNDEERAELDRLWEELWYVSREPLELVTAYEQITAFSTQDRPDLIEAWKPAKDPILKRAAAFQKELVATEPRHLKAVTDIANRAWRRPLSHAEESELRELYEHMRADEISHDAAIRLLLARVMTAPAFLYRLEEPGAGKNANPVSNLELANRLSYFLWASQPDPTLRRIAEAGDLSRSETLIAQTKRMLADPKARRLAVEFGCQWLHLRDFDQNDDKNEALYPEFPTLRVDMYEEVIQFMTHLFQDNGSVLDLLDANHTFLNEALANHYRIPSVEGPKWRRVDLTEGDLRGGLLGMASVLALQSGASRTSPILRGNWVSETLLGERLPRPPLNVPVLPEAVPEGLTARELIEKHSADPSCAKCHRRIDPYGFALEQFDAIGRRRPTNVNTTTQLIDGRSIEGFEGLRDYLSSVRREDFVTQFCRKLLGYALGRSVQLSDRPLLESMAAQLAENDYRVHLAVELIVTSPQFRQIRGRLHDSQ